ncbi:unnamed protein product [Rotaria sp. Silwood1]|nr:unnamed protein product [Rotaria sp. Silwood1]
MKKTIVKALPKDLDVIFVHEHSRIPKVLRRHLNHLEARRRCEHDSQLAIANFAQNDASSIEPKPDTQTSTASSLSQTTTQSSLFSSNNSTLDGLNLNEHKRKRDNSLEPAPKKKNIYPRSGYPDDLGNVSSSETDTTNAASGEKNRRFQAIDCETYDFIEDDAVGFDSESPIILDSPHKRTTLPTSKTDVIASIFKEINNIVASQHPTTSVCTNENRSCFETDDFEQSSADPYVSPDYACDGLSKDVEARLILPHIALTGHTEDDAAIFDSQSSIILDSAHKGTTLSTSKTDTTARILKEINNIVVSQHPTTSTCTDSNIGLIHVAQKDADDFIQVPNHFTLSSDKIHDLVNRKDDSSSKSFDSSAGLTNEINMCTLDSNATTNMRNNNDENIDALSGNNTNNKSKYFMTFFRF